MAFHISRTGTETREMADTFSTIRFHNRLQARQTKCKRRRLIKICTRRHARGRRRRKRLHHLRFRGKRISSKADQTSIIRVERNIAEYARI